MCIVKDFSNMQLHSYIPNAFTSTTTRAGRAWVSNQNALANDLHKKSYKYLFICIHLHSCSTQSASQRKEKKKYVEIHSHFWHSLFIGTQKKKMHRYGIVIFLFFFFFVDLCFFYWYWYWLLYFSGTFSQPYRICLDSLHKENHNDLSIRKFEREKCKQLKDIWEIPTVRRVQFFCRCKANEK